MVTKGPGKECFPCRQLVNGIHMLEMQGHSILEEYPTFDSKTKVAAAFVTSTQLNCQCCYRASGSNSVTSANLCNSSPMRICIECLQEDIWDHDNNIMRADIVGLSVHEKVDIFFARLSCKMRLRHLSEKSESGFQVLRKRKAFAKTGKVGT